MRRTFAVRRVVNDPGEEFAYTRVIVEKPIGRNLQSAREVIRAAGQAFEESQTYRIDHYLGKETVQNLLVLRFANSIFEPLWNNKHIDHVQITVAEEEGLTQSRPPNRRSDRQPNRLLRGRRRYATWCRITCSRCCASSLWSLLTPWTPTWFATARWRSCVVCGRSHR